MMKAASWILSYGRPGTHLSLANGVLRRPLEEAEALLLGGNERRAEVADRRPLAGHLEGRRLRARGGTG
ncbi:MAG: hypothetical protein A2Y55_08795 [Actinobacteria bacterium RBG_16_68_12]|nr:MAG: hypothetical protein A2Y55_08795 [Actinobacteria bacterium RBG_16_68_12]